MAEVVPRNADHQFWSGYLTPKFQAYIRQNGSYTEQQIADHIKAFDTMLSVLGPKLPHPNTKPLLTNLGMPVEFSMNLCDKRQPIVRFELEPLDAQTGSFNDPFGEGCLPGSISTVAGAMNTPVDRRWADQLSTAFSLTTEEKRVARSRMPPYMDRVSLGYFGIGLDDDRRTMKYSTSHMAKYLGGEQTAQSSDSFVLDFVRQLQPGGDGLAPPLDVLKEYFNDPRKLNAPVPLLFLAVDCIAPPKARVKLYGRTHSTAFSSVRDIVTLGGRVVNDETEESLSRLRAIWHLLLNDPKIREDDDYETTPFNSGHYRKGLLVSFEVSAVNPKPEVKIYVPCFQYHESDAVCGRNLEQAFTSLNWDWGQGKYLKIIQTLDEGVPLEKRMTHDYVSFNYSKRQGSYMTMYHVPPVPAETTHV